ncbi:MAG: hypothetical protein AB2693_28470 [Candidatus Thiodiazotropha sp.]
MFDKPKLEKAAIRSISLPSLKKLSYKTVSSYPKMILAAVLCESNFPKHVKAWNERQPLQYQYHGIQQWFSAPAVENAQPCFHFTDSCHILTCLRSKVCTTGISGLQKIAWEKAALDDSTKLNIGLITECVDKQSVPFARRVFGHDVHACMIRQGFKEEGEFCKLIADWFDSEDEPAIPASRRCELRLNLRRWLLNSVNFGKFPPYTQYIKGIPSVTYESLLVNIERKLQLYTACPKHSYNPRAMETQEVEQFFATFRDLETNSNGTPKPDSIPRMLGIVAEIQSYSLDPNR